MINRTARTRRVAVSLDALKEALGWFPLPEPALGGVNTLVGCFKVSSRFPTIDASPDVKKM